MNSSKRKAIAGITSVILGATLLPLMFSSPASGATNNGTATLTQSSGTGATNFTINLGGSASCPGDGNAGYRWQTFMIPAAADIDATLTFGSGGPTAVPTEFRVPLFDTTGSPVVSKLPDIAVAPATTGGISGIPNFNFQVFAPGDIPDGAYKIGVACTLGVASATQLKSYWSQQITITNDATNQDNAKVDWIVSTPVQTTTTTAAPTTTTTAPPTTTPSFTAITPSRVFDTRPGEGGLRTVSKVKISGATELRVKLTDLSGLVPSTGVGAVSLNVTVTQPDGAGYVTVYPCGTRPNASSLNYTAGQTIPNAVIAPVSAQGEVCFFSTQPTHILADVNGWFASGSSFTSVSPSRVFDTRPGEGGLRTVSKVKISGATELRVKLTDLSGLVPSTGVGAVSLNVTVTQPDGAGYVTVYPCGTRPNASSLNYTAGQTIPNAVIAPVSAQGEVCFFSTQPTHILADVNGWFASGSSFTSVSPSRVFDTRPGEGGLRTVSKVKISGATELRVKLTDLSGLVPSTGVGAVSLNVTVTQPDGAGYVTVYPCGTRPNASSLNYTAGETIPNAVIAPVSAQGEVCFFSTQPTHILADVNGWFSN